MQGQLRDEPVSVRIRTTCAHCDRALHLEIDGALRYRVAEEAADPRIFVPLVDFAKLKDLSIVDSF